MLHDRKKRMTALSLAVLTSFMTVSSTSLSMASAGPGGSSGSGTASEFQGPGASDSAPADSSQNTDHSSGTNSSSSVSPNAYKKVNGVYRMADGSTTIPNVLSRGIDVSHWKQDINWSAVAADDVQFAMLGTRYKGGVDPYFHQNAREASAAGLKLGAYIYSYALTVEEAIAEADFVLNLIKDYPISMPIAFDMEDSSQASMSKQQLADLANAFCKRISDAGYYPMIYANDYWLANHLDMSLMNYDVWVARYGAKPVYSTYAMWQATSSGNVNGVNGSVDINFLFKDYSSVLPANQWRFIGNRWYYYQNYAPQSNGWVDDGTAWYYLDQSGQYQTGWLEYGGRQYYLESSGAMATGWRKFDQQWRYFKPSGYMAAGWVLDQDTWYYLDQEGVMQTGWRQVDGSWYYLKPSGAMATGWIQPDNSWYYLDRSGRMMTGMIDVNGKNYYLSPSDGRMAANTEITVNDIRYNVSPDGVCTPVTEETGNGNEHSGELETPESPETGSGKTGPDGGPGVSNSPVSTTPSNSGVQPGVSP